MAKSTHDFSGKTVFITGASLGVGRATAHAFHDAGANVAMVARRLEPLEEAAEGLERSLVISLDVTDLEAIPRAFAQTVERFGSLDGLVNNAGAHFRGPLLTRSANEIATMADVNFKAPLVLSRLAVPLMKEAGGGFVVNVASLAGKVPLDGAATYSATKFGLRAFTYAMAQELAESGVDFSVVSPGPIDTGFIMDEIDEVEDITFSQEICTAEHVAEMILDCAADGRIEREFPPFGGKLATLSYLFPSLRQRVKPLLEKKGRRVKEELKNERGQD